MGQYYRVLNITKKEFIHPHKFGDGMKLLEFGASAEGTMCALALLLAEGNGRGGGDIDSSNPIIGSWARGQIVVAGDYADAESGSEDNLFAQSQNEPWVDISEKILSAMLDDRYLAASLAATFTRHMPDLSPELQVKLNKVKEE